MVKQIIRKCKEKQKYLYAQASLKQFVASRIVCTEREEIHTKSNWSVEIVIIYRNKEFEEFFMNT